LNSGAPTLRKMISWANEKYSGNRALLSRVGRNLSSCNLGEDSVRRHSSFAAEADAKECHTWSKAQSLRDHGAHSCVPLHIRRCKFLLPSSA
jgi:hypothetical protein